MSDKPEPHHHAPDHPEYDGGVDAPFAPKHPEKQLKSSKRHLLHGTGRWSLKKKLLVTAAVLVALFLAADGIYWLSTRGDDDEPTNSLSELKQKYGDLKDPNEVPSLTGPNATDDASLQKDLDTISGALILGSGSLKSFETLLNDKEKQIAVPANSDMANIKARGDEEMGRRLAVLNIALNYVGSTTTLSTDNRNQLSSQIGEHTTNLVMLRFELRDTTSASTAAAKATQLANYYPTYALIAPKLQIIKTADEQLAASSRLLELLEKFGGRVTAASDAKKNISAINTDIQEMAAHVSSGRASASGIVEGVLPLQPTSYDNDHSILSGYKDKLTSAQTHNERALELGKKIAQSLKDL
jgi:hypothetical protein